MPRKNSAVSKEAQLLFNHIKANITARLKVLDVSAYRVSLASGHNQTWISDSFRRSAWVSIAFLADVGVALNVPGRHLAMPPEKFRPSSYALPLWLEEHELRTHCRPPEC